MSRPAGYFGPPPSLNSANWGGAPPPRILRIQHETLMDGVPLVAESPGDGMSEHNLATEAADVLETGHGKTRVHNEIRTAFHKGADLFEQLVSPVPYGNLPSEDEKAGQKGLERRLGDRARPPEG